MLKRTMLGSVRGVSMVELSLLTMAVMLGGALGLRHLGAGVGNVAQDGMAMLGSGGSGRRVARSQPPTEARRVAKLPPAIAP